MRQKVTNPRKLRRLAIETGLKIESVMIRGGSDHTYFIFCEDGVMYYYRRGWEKPQASDCRKGPNGIWTYISGGTP